MQARTHAEDSSLTGSAAGSSVGIEIGRGILYEEMLLAGFEMLWWNGVCATAPLDRMGPLILSVRTCISVKSR